MKKSPMRKPVISGLYLTLYLSMQLFLQLLFSHNIEEKKPFLYFSIGLWIVSIILTASIQYLRGKGAIFPILANGVAAAMAIHAYMLHIDRELTATLYGLILLGSLLFLFLLFLVSKWKFIINHEIILVIVIVVMVVASILLWIFLDDAIYSQVFFALIMTIAFYVGAEEPGKPGSKLESRLVYSSFGSIFVIITVAMIIFSTGDFLEGLIPGGEGRRTRKKS